MSNYFQELAAAVNLEAPYMSADRSYCQHVVYFDAVLGKFNVKSHEV